MAQVSVRIQKLKCSNISGAKKHNQRLHQPDNADPERQHLNQTFFSNEDLDTLVFSRIKNQNAKIIESGKNSSTIAIEMVLSASPEYFRDDISKSGEYDQDKMESWRDANLKFLQDKYGENLLRVDLHLDESTPHMHAIITPLIQKKRKVRGKNEYKNVTVLDAKNMFNRKALVELQSEAAQAVSHLNIERGLRGSKAKHKTIKQFYSQVTPTPEKPLCEPIFDSDISIIGGMSKADLQAYANENFEMYESLLSDFRQKVSALEIKLEQKTKQLHLFSKYQSINGDEQGFIDKVGGQIHEGLSKVATHYESKYSRLAEQHNQLAEQYKMTLQQNIELRTELEGHSYLQGNEFIESQHEIDVAEVNAVEAKKFSKEKEIQKAKDEIEKSSDLDDWNIPTM